jgi:uncharacterized protein (DUF2342 family)
VVAAAASDRMPGAQALREASRRRRAAGGPAEQTFAALVGLELRPRRLREATAVWAALTEHRGISGRDALWGHPDLMPDEDAFTDPAIFAGTALDLSDLEAELAAGNHGEEEGGDSGGATPDDSQESG